MKNHARIPKERAAMPPNPHLLSFARHVQDPIHGSIGLTAAECQVIDTPLFQRLRHIKQLGNTAYVFPGATHTRMSHSLGVMHQASRLFEAIFQGGASQLAEEWEPQEHAALLNVHQFIRLAGLMHDLGHGPYSHTFEGFLERCEMSWQEWPSTELKIPMSWIRKDQRQTFAREPLCHEHYSFGAIAQIMSSSDARTVCSLLDERIVPGQHYLRDLTLLANAIARSSSSGPRSSANELLTQSLHRCFKSLLSSDIDADRMDYLQRDALFCGVRVSLDLEHLLSSLELRCINDRFAIHVKRNAVFAIEQILLARKQMFDQVYQNRVTQLIDDLLFLGMEELRSSGVLRPPTTVNEFLRLTDASLNMGLERLISNAQVRAQKEYQGDLAIKMYLTRTLPVTCETRFVEQTQLAQTRKDLMRRSSGGRVVHTPLKELVGAEKRIKKDLKNDVLVTELSKEAGPVALRNSSELILSSAWSTPQFQVVLTESLYESAKKRGLSEKLLAMGYPKTESKPRKTDTPQRRKKQN